MRALNIVGEPFTRLAGLTAPRRRRPPFVCGECERWQRCGLPQDDRCIVMAAQLARGARPVKRLSLSSYGYLPNGRARYWWAV
jgi:hypothetical protein